MGRRTCDNFKHFYILLLNSLVYISYKYEYFSPALVSHSCPLLPERLRSGRSLGSRPTQANSSQDLISKIIRAKWIRDMIQTVECLVCKHKVLSSNSSHTKKKKVFFYITVTKLLHSEK
jgi:hypothetical protein